ncbi:G-type lectin S-receptor-like serine/threonine-protein kinase LECRK1 [Phalaenopsis equestris]|uniref:G-type lectin S-receptor-like serine/threonine-protein kinase LECRK1 n=1 Tax=Phalaenopsis equestris TaxID=78828 RepID=UPI0009E65DF5|nr:G-type lectin S-receptor-like serine/threonine-protein kinase LECRK1 [Phalaenopsis equestris]
MQNSPEIYFFFFFFTICISVILDAVEAQGKAGVPYANYRPIGPGDITGRHVTVGTSLTTDDTSSWFSSSGRFAFGFYHEDDGFSIGIRLFASPSETLVVWTARPELKRFAKDAFLNFTDKGLFVTPDQKAESFPLFNFSSTATSAAMLDNGNLVVFNSNSSTSDSKSCQAYSSCSRTGVRDAAKPYLSPNRPCSAYSTCRSSSDNMIWRSFDFPTDTILGSQSLHCGNNLTSSAGKTDHSIGIHILNLPCGGANLISYRRNSAEKTWDTRISGDGCLSLNLDRYGRLYIDTSGGNEKDLSGYKPNTIANDMLYRATLDSDSIFRLYALSLHDNLTKVVNEIPFYKDKCQAKDICGVNSYCFLANSNAQCSCMPGFEYINPNSQFAGCRRNRTVPSCCHAAAIVSMEAVDNIVGMEDFAYSIVDTESQEKCSNVCLSDCSCDAASYIDQKCLKLKLPLTSGRKDVNFHSIALMKLAGAGGDEVAPAGQNRKREICYAAIFISAAVAISACITAIAAFMTAYWFLFGRYREEWRKWELALTEEIAPRYFSYQELLRGSNEPERQLGRGAHGTVHRADLQIGDQTIVVAVKKLHGAEMEGEREFQAEMRLIGRAHHANLVRLLGFCHDGPNQLIVYELMSRGPLSKHIFVSRNQRLCWERRVAILLDAARGIQYLHCDCETKIIHRDIKPENILISEDWRAKIADFGLAKLLDRNQSRVATRTLAAGTEGYVAPECEREVDGTEEALVTEKVDVYSYGIVVLETICSRRNREVKPSLCELVRKSCEEGELWKLVEGEQVEAFQVEKLVKVGLLCVQEDPNERPIMEVVVMMLEGYVDVPTSAVNRN